VHKLGRDEGREDWQGELGHVVLEELGARDGQVDRLGELDAQHALHGEPSRVEPAEGRGELLWLLDRLRSDANLAIDELRRRDLLDVGDAIAVFVLPATATRRAEERSEGFLRKQSCIARRITGRPLFVRR
jgi:hypothetical protein